MTMSSTAKVQPLRARSQQDGGGRGASPSSSSSSSSSSAAAAGEGGGVSIRRDISLLHATAVITGSVIGSGIFISPISISRHAGSVGLSLILWGVCGLLNLLNALCYVELGCLYPRQGGQYVFIREISGRLAGFLFVWMSFFALEPSSLALISLATADYLLTLVYPTCNPSDSLVSIVAILVFVSVISVNLVHVRYVARLQTSMTLFKLVPLLLIIGAGFARIFKGQADTLSSGFEGTNTNPGAAVLAIFAGSFSFGGWGYLLNVLEEVKNPERVVPRATTFSLLAVTVLYVLTNVAYFSVMTPQEMTQSTAVAATFAGRTLGPIAFLMPLFVACSTAGALNGFALGGSRLPFAAARDGLFPSIMATIHQRFRTPWVALLATCLITCCYIVTGDALALIQYSSFVAYLSVTVTLACVLYLRYSKPNVHRPFKMPLVLVVVATLLSLMILLIGLYQQPTNNGIGVLILLSGIPVYVFGVTYTNKPSSFRQRLDRIYTVIQKTLLVVHSDPDAS